MIADDLLRLEGLLETVRQGIREIHDRTPAAAVEGDLKDFPENPGFSTQVRSTLRCLLADYIEPALRDLRRLMNEYPRT
jgi:hypothetical protein